MIGVCVLLFVLTQFALFTPGASPIVGMAFSQNEWGRNKNYDEIWFDDSVDFSSIILISRYSIHVLSVLN